jgi:hypothetical protein
MPEKDIAQLSINQVYTVLKNKKNYPNYQTKYASLNEKSNSNLLKQINEELESSKELVKLFNNDVLKGLINPEDKAKADELVKEINQKRTITPDSIKEQFDEFIDFSELLFCACTTWNTISAPAVLRNFAFLTKLKFNLFLANLNRCLQSASKEDHQLEMIAKILIKDYFPAVANASYDILTQGILLTYDTDTKKLKDAIEANDIPALEDSLRIYQAKMLIQKEMITPTDRSDSDDEDYYSCYEYNEAENSNRLDDSESDGYYSCNDGDEDEDCFVDALEDQRDESSLSIEQPAIETDEKPNDHLIQRLMQRLINWLQNLMYRLHILHRTEENPSRTTLSTVQEIDPVDISDTVSITSSIELEKPTNSPVLPSIETWEKQERTFELLSKSTGNLCNFYPEKNNETIVDNAPQTKNVVCLLRSLSTISVSL